MQVIYSRYLSIISFAGLFLTLFAGGKINGCIEFFELVVFIFSLYLICSHNFSKSALNASVLALTKCFVAIACILIVQIVPLPISILKIASPVSASAYSYVGAEYGFISLSIEATLSGIFWILAVGMLALSLILADKSRQEKTSWLQTSSYLSEDSISARLESSIIISGLIASTVALYHYLSKLNNYFGLTYFNDLFRETRRAHFPFTNPDHLAFLIEISWPFVLLKLLSSYIDFRDARNNSNIKRKRLQTLLFWLAALFVLFSTVFLTMSKSGMLLTLIGFTFIAWKVLSSKNLQLIDKKALSYFNYNKKLLVILFSILFLTTAASFILFLLGNSGQELLTQRLEKGLIERIDETREALVSSSLLAFNNFYLFGAGLGCWHLAVAPHALSELAEWRLDFAHNDFLQAAVELGIFGLVIILWGLWSVLKIILQSHNLSRNSSQTNLQYLRANIYIVSFVCPLIHAFFDFPFHVPALLVTYMFLTVIVVRDSLN